MKINEHYWAYGVTNGRVVLVRCDTPDDAEFERSKMKQSDAKTVGSVTRKKVAEADVVEAMLERGYEIELIRDFV